MITVDTRNAYEVKIGTFEGALDPATRLFREFNDYVKANLDPARHKRVAMFCTGGIRCEKATAYMLAQGFEEVYHLKGGILKYLEEVPPEESRWRGECFVFDERVALRPWRGTGHARHVPALRNAGREIRKRPPRRTWRAAVYGVREGVSKPTAWPHLCRPLSALGQKQAELDAVSAVGGGQLVGALRKIPKITGRARAWLLGHGVFFQRHPGGFEELRQR